MPNDRSKGDGPARVSVVIPVYNAGAYLRMSVQSILAQTYSHLEVIVVDDGSTDGCVAALADLRDPRLRTITQPNGGQSSAKNRGLAQLSGEFYITQDADDVSHPCRVERQVEYLTEHPEVAAVFTGHNLIIGDGIVAPRVAGKTVEACRQDIDQFRMPAHGPTAMYRVAPVRGMWFDPFLSVAEDLDYVLRVGERYPMAVLGECLYSYRVNIGSTSRKDPTQSRRMERQVIERACRRRGLNPAAHVLPPRGSSTRFAHRYREEVVPHFMESVLDARRGRHWAEALHTAATCLRLHAWDPYYYKPLVYSIVPLRIVELYRHRKHGPAQTETVSPNRHLADPK
jgi:glycosyltransferase involved in cell wall biosynthesis